MFTHLYQTLTEGVGAFGDCASTPGPDGRPYLALAQHAVRAARVRMAVDWTVSLFFRPHLTKINIDANQELAHNGSSG